MRGLAVLAFDRCVERDHLRRTVLDGASGITAVAAGDPVEVVLDEVLVRLLVIFAELSVYKVCNELCYNVRAQVVPVIFVEVPEGLLELAGLDEYHLQNLRRDGFRRTGVLVGTMCFRHCFVVPARDHHRGNLELPGSAQKDLFSAFQF